MTHGDALLILKQKTGILSQKMEALKFIFENELETDFNCLNKRELYELVRFLYKELVILKNQNKGE